MLLHQSVFVFRSVAPFLLRMRVVQNPHCNPLSLSHSLPLLCYAALHNRDPFPLSPLLTPPPLPFPPSRPRPSGCGLAPHCETPYVCVLQNVCTSERCSPFVGSPLSPSLPSSPLILILLLLLSSDCFYSADMDSSSSKL